MKAFAIGIAVLATISAPVLVTDPAQAAPVPAVVGCVTGTPAPAGREIHDTATASAAVKAQVDQKISAVLNARRVAARSVSGRTGAATGLPSQITVPVVLHVIHGTHRGDRNISRTAARNLMTILRGGYNGAQDPTMVPTGVSFVFSRLTVNRNDSWYHARPMSRSDKQMKRSLHRGGPRTLNVYLNNVQTPDGALLGYSRFPWQYAGTPLLDGITINVRSLPGGGARGYNLGDTIVHESGHWIGLFHTFEGGCAGNGDAVNDTPAEAEPSFECEKTRDTCPTPLPPGWTAGDPLPAPVADPVTNFMDYSYDSCMNHFTPGQRERMIASWVSYRTGR
ncbi:MAG: zinc metalloprotease [Marmoricola sp.]